MSKAILFEEESEDEITIKTENEYAKKYDAWRSKEELHKLEQKYGSNPLNSDASISSDSEDESDEPPEVSEETEAQFLKTLALLKTKDPRIYDPDYKFFDEEKEKQPEKETKTRGLTFADSDEDDDDGGDIFSIEKKAEIDTEKDNAKESKSNAKKKPKEGKLKEFLTGKAEHIDDEVEKDLAPLKALWSDPKLSEGEAFLRDYILNKRYLEEGDPGDAEDKVRDDEDLEKDEQTVEEQGKFERAYNFRFEEPDEEYLKRFPRTMNSIRPKDDSRSRKRAEVRARKEEEKRRKMEEIARLKALKLKEIQEKIAKIKEVTGNEDLAFKEEDIEGDFDPDEHDKRMKALFDEEFYGEVDNEKPVFPDLDEELEIENWDNYDPENDIEKSQDPNEDGPHCEDEEFNMDADYDPKKARENLLEEMKRNMGKKRRNRKRKSKLGELLASEKPKFVPTVADKTYAEYMEEYYKMDCEDVIGGDLPTRFKYREVMPNDFGLTIEEILLADDKELTQWVPLKKIVKHRPANVEKGEVKTYAQKAADVKLKRKMLPSLFKDLPEEPEIVVPVEEATKKKKKKKKKNKQKDSELEGDNSELNHPENIPHDIDANGDTNVTEVTSKKSKIKQLGDESTVEVDKEDNNTQTEVKEGKKKRKKNKSRPVLDDAQNEGPNQESKVTIDIDKPSKEKINNNKSSPEEGKLKRKMASNIGEQGPNKKIKHNNFEAKKHSKKNSKKKFKHKEQNNKDKTSDNPLSTLSDERLKAYGLNPKKYRGFLKYKKF